ncbi:hypothetical protein Angca_005128 [Angiostrongylus cantonensis]|nr:hypothetical protein Angca_005128 [Angiostrongylus cantonensis]
MDWLINANGDVESIPDYDCTDSDRKTGYTNIWFGISFLIYGVIAELVYSIVLSVMMRKQHSRLSCYKIMIALGVNDMAALMVNSLLTGYLWIIGANYCYSPKLIFIAGSMGLGLWCCACMNCLLLAINRFLDVSNKQLKQTLFGNKRTYLVLLIPFIYCLYFIFYTPPILFNSDHMAWFFTTFAPHSNIENYYNYPHTVNNLLVVVVTTLIYVVYSKELLRNLQISNGLSWAQKSFFIQSSLICFANLVASVIYVYMQFFYAPPSFVLVGHMGWQLGHGFPAFVYLLLNKTIQREVLQMLGIRKRQHAVAPRTRNTSKTPGTEG